jgi:hypothetical protein
LLSSLKKLTVLGKEKRPVKAWIMKRKVDQCKYRKKSDKRYKIEIKESK